ncbi:MAG: molecular chaperone DnaK [Acidobacteriaceae bacterium]
MRERGVMAENEIIVGIDLGTTNSLVAFMQGERPMVIPGEDGSNLLPSVVGLDVHPEKGERIIVGNRARKVLIEHPERAVYSVKRLMGRGVEDVQEELKFFPFRLAESSGNALKIKLGERDFTAPEISAYILLQLKKNAERYFGRAVTKAVVTVPAYFNDAQRQATKDAGRIAGLEVLRLVNEPTAAALAYGLDKEKEGIVAVYDLGGGTFDISILKLKDGIFEVIATNGDTHLGGDDIDNALLSVAMADIEGDLQLDVRHNGEVIQALRKSIIDAKILLSSAEVATIDVDLPEGKRYQREMSRAAFETMIEPIVQRTAQPVKQAIKDAGLRGEDIEEVVLVGGSTRIPRVNRLVSELFGLDARGKKPHTELNPDEVVALGAAVQANILGGGSAATADMLLLDVTPLSLGIESLGGVVSKIIQRNSTIPASATEHFTTGVDGQANVAIHVVQGERELASDCRSLARFDLKGIPGMAAGIPRIEVKFVIDANGILHVSAREQRSGKQAEIEVKPTYGLTDDQVEKMILDSFDYAEEDLGKRQTIEARNEAENLALHLEKAKSSAAWQRISAEERARIEELAAKLRRDRESEDYKLIRQSIEDLDKASRNLAELMMDTAVGSAIRGQTMEDASQSLGQEVTAPHPFAPAEITRE